MMSPPSLWDRQRAAVQGEIADAALVLFLDQGFDATTIEQIVAAVGISRRSFFRYFGTKEDVVLGDLVARGGAIAEALRARPDDEAPWDALRTAMHESAESTMPDAQAGLAFGRMLFETPALHARHLEKQQRWREMLVPLIAARMAGDQASVTLRASAIVSSALACLDAASQEWVASGGTRDLAALYDDAVEAVRS